MSRKGHTVVQCLLLVFWVVVLVTQSPVLVSSQTCTDPDYMWQNPLRRFWTPNPGEVVVTIDERFKTQYPDAPDADFLIEEGLRKWNDQPICSNIRFIGFNTQAFSAADYDRDAEFHHVDWEVDDPGNGFNGGAISHLGFGEFVIAATIKISPTLVVPDHRAIYFNYLGSHEIGHTFNLSNCSGPCSPSSIMGGHTNTLADANGPGPCDIQKVSFEYCPPPVPSPSPTPSPTPPQTESECQSQGWQWDSFTSSCSPSGFVGPCPDNCTELPGEFGDPGQGGSSCGGVPTDFCVYPSGGCEPGYASSGTGCCCSSFNSPIVIDLSGNGFSLTSAADGVDFDINGDGIKERLAWTANNSDDAWLVLDHSNNGRIDNGRELFGNYSPQSKPPRSTPANGFLSLAEYDKNRNGGNADGMINKSDAVFSRLRLWRDENHNGIADVAELHTLADLQLVTLELDYKESKQTDVYGNKFRYRAKVKNVQGQQMGRWAWDVFLVKSVN